MIRKDREVTDLKRIDEIISACECINIGFNDDGEVYVLPLNFGYEFNGDKLTFYFHSATAGRKIDIMKKNPKVAFAMEANMKLLPSDLACDHTAIFSSVVGTGEMKFIEGLEAKRQGLQIMMKQNTGKDNWEFPEETVNRTCVYKLEVSEYSCKENRG